MAQLLIFGHPAAPHAVPMPATAPSGRLARLIATLVAWRRRTRLTLAYRGFDRHQRRDLGIGPLDLW